MPRLIGDERRLKQVIINLVRNAIKFTKADGKIHIRAYYHEAPLNGLFVQVVDSGVGFTPEDRDTLFTRFGKLQRTAKINSEGLGLGLMIVKQIVESAGGKVAGESQGVNQGSSFYIVYPLKVAQGCQQISRESEDMNYLRLN